jgi:hypothetical protein
MVQFVRSDLCEINKFVTKIILRVIKCWKVEAFLSNRDAIN